MPKMMCGLVTSSQYNLSNLETSVKEQDTQKEEIDSRSQRIRTV